MTEVQSGGIVLPPTAPAAPVVEAAPTQAPAQASKGNKSAEKATAEAEPKKLSGAELKKQKQLEKAAKRAQAKASGPPQKQDGPAPKEGQKQQKDSKQQPKKEESRPLPVRRRPSQSNIPQQPEPKKESKKQSFPPKAKGLFFQHLMNQPRVHSMTGASKDVHPAILQLGLQYSSYTICGSTARMVSMLEAFKAVIEFYKTPIGTSLARHLTSHGLSPQIEFLRSCRPISITMGNAIRWLKDIIIKIDPQKAEADAKQDLITAIDEFIHEKVTIADRAIVQHAIIKIKPGDVILTYASSSIVEKTLVQAHKQGIPFTVIVVDSKPLFEGKRLVEKLYEQGLRDIKYTLISMASHAVKQATKVYLGAHAMMSNGYLYSRVGTAIVSMLAKAQNLEVIVLCESIKFTDRVALDSIVGNELAPASEILSETERQQLLPLQGHLPEGLLKKLASKEPSQEKDKDAEAEKKLAGGDVLKWVAAADNLQMLQILYDVTHTKYIAMVVCEHGVLPPSSVPVVHRLREGQ